MLSRSNQFFRIVAVDIKTSRVSNACAAQLPFDRLACHSLPTTLYSVTTFRIVHLARTVLCVPRPQSFGAFFACLPRLRSNDRSIVGINPLPSLARRHEPTTESNWVLVIKSIVWPIRHPHGIWHLDLGSTQFVHVRSNASKSSAAQR